jgi:hypothetical protein
VTCGDASNSIRFHHMAVSAGPAHARGFDPPREACFRFTQARCAARSLGGLVRIAKGPAFAADTSWRRAHGRHRQPILSREHGRIPSTLTGSRQSRPTAASHFKKNRQALSLLSSLPISSLPKRPARFSERTTGFVCFSMQAPRAAKSAASAVSRARHPSSRLRASSPGGINSGAATREHSDHKDCLSAAESGQVPHPIYGVWR